MNEKILIIENEFEVNLTITRLIHQVFKMDTYGFLSRHSDVGGPVVNGDITTLFSAENMSNKDIASYFETNNILVFHSTIMQWQQFVGLTKIALALHKANKLKIKKVYMSYYEDTFNLDNVKNDLREVCDEIEFNELLNIVEFNWYCPNDKSITMIKDI